MRASFQALIFTIALVGGMGVLGAAFETKTTGQSKSELNIISEPPGAEVLLDGKLLGKTPLTRPSPAGSHRLTFRLAGYAQAEAQLQGSQRLHQRLEALPANLQVKDLEKAELRLGPGVPRLLEGKGPWKLAPGRYELTATRDKIPAKPRRFEVKPGQTVEIALDWPTLSLPPAAPTMPPSVPAQPRPEPVLPGYRPSARPAYQPLPRYNIYSPPRPVYRPPVQRPEPLFTPLPPARFEPPAPPPSYPAGPEPVFTPLP